jgi:RNA polymerase sigma factor (sigma-70 family)
MAVESFTFRKAFLMLEDKLLIWKFNRGNTEALRRIYEKYKDYLVTLATGLLIEKQAAEDTIHDVFVSLIRSAGEFRLTGSLKSYLATCVANNARNRNKALSRHQNLGLESAELITSSSLSPDRVAIFGEKLQKVTVSLAALPYDQREVIILRHYSNMKFKTIAEMKNESINTIQGRYRYGLDKLRSLLNSEVIK